MKGFIRRLRRFSQIKHKAFVFEARATEIQQQCFMQTAGLKIVKNLCGLISRQSDNGLEFDQHCIKAHEVGAIAGCQWHATIGNLERNFPPKRNVSSRQLDSHSLLIDSFQETMTKFAMNGHCSANQGIALPVALSVNSFFFNLRNLRHLRINTSRPATQAQPRTQPPAPAPPPPRTPSPRRTAAPTPATPTAAPQRPGRRARTGRGCRPCWRGR